MNYYIGERINPQFKKNYFTAYGKMSKKEARKKEDCIYGSMIMASYPTEQAYLTKIEELKNLGYTVYTR